MVADGRVEPDARAAVDHLAHHASTDTRRPEPTSALANPDGARNVDEVGGSGGGLDARLAHVCGLRVESTGVRIRERAPLRTMQRASRNAEARGLMNRSGAACERRASRVRAECERRVALCQWRRVGACATCADECPPAAPPMRSHCSQRQPRSPRARGGAAPTRPTFYFMQSTERPFFKKPVRDCYCAKSSTGATPWTPCDACGGQAAAA